MKEFAIEQDWISNGLRCIALKITGRHRCGYVGVLEGHPLFGMDYSSHIDRKLPDDELVGNRGIIPLFLQSCNNGGGISLDCFFNVHGGITYSRLTGPGSDYPGVVEFPTWFFGFDCAHYQDNYEGGRPLEYVVAECESFAKQVADFK